jgi:sulfate permease, SulP family
LEIGAVLVLLAITGLADRLSVVFTKPVIRSLQFGVGTLLILSAVDLARKPPALFEPVPSTSVSVLLAIATVVVVAVAAYRQWFVLSVAVLAAGLAVGWMSEMPRLGTLSLDLPTLQVPPMSALSTAFVLLVIPQIPLTYGNAVVGVSDLAREHFGERARRVTPGRVALSCGLGNVGSALVGGMPMCHGSSGFSAHVRLGARNPAMNLLLGGTLVVFGVAFSQQILVLLGLLPVWALAGFLGYTGVRHALLVFDLRGGRLAVALLAGVAGIATGNLAVTTAVALAAEHGRRLRMPSLPARWGRSSHTPR